MAVAQQPSRPDVYRLYIDGQWVDAASGETFENINPATGEVLGVFAKGGEEDARRAVEAARRAFERWRKVPAPRRAEILFRAAELILQRKETLARQMTQEMGKVLAEARGDVQEGIDMTYFIAGEGRRLYGYTTPAEMPDKAAMAVRAPIGVVAAITPWNFPFAIPTWKIIPALVAGNTVVFKPASDTPWMAYEFVRILEEAGLPKGVINLVYGPGSTVGETLIRHPEVDLISFTGSSEMGRHVAQVAGADLKRVHLELGGKAPVVVFEDADIEKAAAGIAEAGYFNAGQDCTAACRVLVSERIAADFTAALTEQAKNTKVGAPNVEDAYFGPVNNASQLARVQGFLDRAPDHAEVLTGGSRLTGEGYDGGYFFAPTVVGGLRQDDEMVQEEIFGPVITVQTFSDEEQAVAWANGVKYGLSASVWTKDHTRAMRMTRLLDFGAVWVNTHIPFVSEMPHGGFKHSGYGKDLSMYGFEDYTRIKHVMHYIGD